MPLDFGNNLFDRSRFLKPKEETIVTFPPGALTHKVDAGPTWDIFGPYHILRNAQGDGANAFFRMPDDYDGGEISLEFWWENTVANNNYYAGIYVTTFPGDVGSHSYQRTKTIAAGAATFHAYSHSIRINELAGGIPIKPGWGIAIGVFREGAHANDTNAGSFLLLMLNIKFSKKERYDRRD